MKRRIIDSTFAIVLACVTVLGIPLAVLARHQVTTVEAAELAGQASSIAAAVEDTADAGRPIDLQRLAARYPGLRIAVVSGTGSATAGPALRGARLTAVARFAGGEVRVDESSAATSSRADAMTFSVAALALVGLVAAVALAGWQGRRLSRPLVNLAQVAGADPTGRRPLALPRCGIEEIDELAEVLERSSRATAGVIERQRDFAADAAHQLRTPLTGVALRLEEIAAIGSEAVATEAAEAAAQVERLEAVIVALLERARGDAAPPQPIDVHDLVAGMLEPWRHLLSTQSRTLHFEGPEGVWVEIREAHLRGVVGCLLDNAVVHGHGAVTISVEKCAAAARLKVTDEGPGVPAGVAEQIFERRFSVGGGTGIGLALARALAEGEGGTLEVRGATFVVELPPAPRPPGRRAAGGRQSVTTTRSRPRLGDRAKGVVGSRPRGQATRPATK